MKKKPIKNPHLAIEKAGIYQWRYLEGELLRFLDGTNRFGNLNLLGAKKMRGQSDDGRIFKRADDGIGWEEIDEAPRDTGRRGNSIRAMQGGAPGLGKKS